MPEEATPEVKENPAPAEGVYKLKPGAEWNGFVYQTTRLAIAATVDGKMRLTSMNANGHTGLSYLSEERYASFLAQTEPTEATMTATTGTTYRWTGSMWQACGALTPGMVRKIIPGKQLHNLWHHDCWERETTRFVILSVTGETCKAYVSIVLDGELRPTGTHTFKVSDVLQQTNEASPCWELSKDNLVFWNGTTWGMRKVAVGSVHKLRDGKTLQTDEAPGAWGSDRSRFAVTAIDVEKNQVSLVMAGSHPTCAASGRANLNHFLTVTEEASKLANFTTGSLWWDGTTWQDVASLIQIGTVRKCRSDVTIGGQPVNRTARVGIRGVVGDRYQVTVARFDTDEKVWTFGDLSTEACLLLEKTEPAECWSQVVLDDLVSTLRWNGSDFSMTETRNEPIEFGVYRLKDGAKLTTTAGATMGLYAARMGRISHNKQDRTVTLSLLDPYGMGPKTITVPEKDFRESTTKAPPLHWAWNTYLWWTGALWLRVGQKPVLKTPSVPGVDEHYCRFGVRAMLLDAATGVYAKYNPETGHYDFELQKLSIQTLESCQIAADTVALPSGGSLCWGVGTGGGFTHTCPTPKVTAKVKRYWGEVLFTWKADNALFLRPSWTQEASDPPVKDETPVKLTVAPATMDRVLGHGLCPGSLIHVIETEGKAAICQWDGQVIPAAQD